MRYTMKNETWNLEDLLLDANLLVVNGLPQENTILMAL